MIEFTSWLANSFGDGEQPEPLRRWRIDATVRIPYIEPDQLCTWEQAERWARDMIGRLLCELDDYEVTGLSIEEVEEDE